MSVPTPNAAARHARRWPVRLILVGIVFALVLPAIGFCAVLLDRIYTVERTRSRDAAQAAALRAAESLDREISNLGGALLALSTSGTLRSGDLAGFQAQAEQVAAALGQSLVLSDPAGQQLVNTRRPFGSALPVMGSTDTLRRAIETKALTVSDLFVGASDGRLAVAVQFPVVHGGTVDYVLAMSLQPAYLSGLLQKQGLPPGWIATVSDGAYRIVARTVEADRYVGQEIPAAILPRSGDEARLWVGSTVDGRQILAATRRLRLADWRVGVGVPVRVIEAPLRSTMMLLAVTGAVTLVLACLLAWVLANLVSRPLTGLARSVGAQGQGQGQGQGMAEIRSPIAEVDAVATALVAATRHLEERVAARTAELVTANRRLHAEAAARAAAEEQLRQAQKMEAVGQLTGGIAHDFNNLLTIVIGSLDLLRRRAADDRSKRLLDNALDGAARAATLTARLLAFSRRQPLVPRTVDPNRLVRGMSDLLRRTLGDAVSVETVLAGGAWQAHVDQNQLENALLNLAVNARDAILAGTPGTGRIEIGTANAVLGAADLVQDPDVAQGEYVALSVADTGAGMTPEVAARVFEPFFTTKPVGQGTGLGLSQVHGFVKQSGGHVSLRTRPGAGTTVTLYLPRHVGEAAAPKAAAPAAEPSAGPMTVLLVEDDAGVRRTSAETLRELGHMPLEAQDAAEAMRLLAAHPEVALLMTDVVLPGIDGPGLAAEARRVRPGLHVLFVSGFTGEDAAAGGRLPTGTVLLQKPYAVQALAAKIRTAVGP